MTDRNLLLAIDSGNTNVVFGLFDRDQLIGEWRTSTDAKKTADEYAVWFTQLIALHGIARTEISGAIIASVVPQTIFPLTNLCKTYFAVEPVNVSNRTDLGIKVHLPRPEEVGADRLVNAVAAHDQYDGWLTVVDFGTATTFDVISEEGAYEGGIIAPGVNLSIEALERAAARLPRIGITRPPTVVGQATIPAMQSGVYWGYVGLIEGLVKRIQGEINQPMTVIATGGLAALFNDATDVIDAVEPQLTLNGLRLVYERSVPA